MTDVDNLPTRRGFLDWLTGLGSLITGAAMAVPALMYLWPAARGGTAEKVEVAGAAYMNVGQSETMRVGGQAVIVVRDRSGYKAFAAACTHLGCLVQWDPTRKEFLCPCHAAVFDANGGVVAGPPPSPLLAYKVDEVDGKVYVSAS